jgi:hypothetical protein
MLCQESGMETPEDDFLQLPGLYLILFHLIWVSLSFGLWVDFY